MKDNTLLWVAGGTVAAFYFYKLNQTKKAEAVRAALIADAMRLLEAAGESDKLNKLERVYDSQVASSDASIERLRPEFPAIVEAERGELELQDELDDEVEDDEIEVVDERINPLDLEDGWEQ